MSLRPFPVAFVMAVGAPFESSFSPHSSTMSSTCLLFDSNSKPSGLHLIVSTQVFSIGHLTTIRRRSNAWQDLCVEVCRQHTIDLIQCCCRTTRDKVITMTRHHVPMVLGDEHHWDYNSRCASLFDQCVSDLTAPTLARLSCSVPQSFGGRITTRPLPFAWKIATLMSCLPIKQSCWPFAFFSLQFDSQ